MNHDSGSFPSHRPDTPEHGRTVDRSSGSTRQSASNTPRQPALHALSAAEREMLAEASALIESRYKPDQHSVAAVVLMASGKTYKAVNVDTYLGRAAVCAEAAAIATAMTAGETEVKAVVAVRHPRPNAESQAVSVVSPCGICREMITDYGPEAVVAIPVNGSESPAPDMPATPHQISSDAADQSVAMVSATHLLPIKFTRR